MIRSLRSGLYLVLALLVISSLQLHAAGGGLFSKPKPLAVDAFPERPRPLIEWGDPFLGTGKVQKGFKVPTGATWNPSFMMYGSLRTAVQTYDAGDRRFSEWASRLELLGNLQLSATERFVVGFRPFDRLNQYSGYQFEPGSLRGWNDHFRATPHILFFEGEFGEIFPGLDKNDHLGLDYGLSVGRQPLRLQEGLILEDDSIDLVGITRNALLMGGASHLKVSSIFAWNEIEGANNIKDPGGKIVGLTSFMDFEKTTFEFDSLYALSPNQSDGVFIGLGAIRRFGLWNATLRGAFSQSTETEDARTGNGWVFFSQLSRDLPHSHDLVYFNSFWAIDQFSSASRAPDAGGPLGRMGILFSAVGLGHFASPLNNHTHNNLGAALGYQKFFGELKRTQLIIEAGGLTSTDDGSESAEALGVRFQKAFGRRHILITDVFGALQSDHQETWGLRGEWLIKF